MDKPICPILTIAVAQNEGGIKHCEGWCCGFWNPEYKCCGLSAIPYLKTEKK